MNEELFRTLLMLKQCRKELEEGDSEGATLGECDCLAEVYLITLINRN